MLVCIPDFKQEGKGSGEDLMTVTLERVTGRQLGIRLSGGETEPTAGIFVAGKSIPLDLRKRIINNKVLYLMLLNI